MILFLLLLLQISAPPTIDLDVAKRVWKADAALMDMWQAHSGFVKEFNSKFRNAPPDQHKRVVVYWIGVWESYYQWRRQTIRDGQMSGKVRSVKSFHWKRVLLLRLGSFAREVEEVRLTYRSERWERFKEELREFREVMEKI